MPKQEDSLSTLNAHIPRPETGPSKRHMLAIDSDAYNFISETAEKLKTTRNRVLNALIAEHKENNA